MTFLDAFLSGDDDNPLKLSCKSEKDIRTAFAIDVLLDATGVGNRLAPVQRIMLQEAADYRAGEAISIPVVSYFDDARQAPMWGPRRPLDGAVDDETFAFGSFIVAKIVAVETGEAVIAFTLRPKVGRDVWLDAAQRLAALNSTKQIAWANDPSLPREHLKAHPPLTLDNLAIETVPV